ncbi:hypothetical protein ACGFX8_36735 [Streptomyces sp. NPDC048362]|uniref:hypothetical protein n=1 Tax=Streptomyces sp. NPDC048362 TaxID=3365539 RepID=UPI0037169F0C
MASDLCPVDLLLQRMGRLHRHPRGPGQSERPGRLRRARCLLAGADRGNSVEDVPSPVGGSVAAYGKYLCSGPPPRLLPQRLGGASGAAAPGHQHARPGRLRPCAGGTWSLGCGGGGGPGGVRRLPDGYGRAGLDVPSSGGRAAREVPVRLGGSGRKGRRRQPGGRGAGPRQPGEPGCRRGAAARGRQPRHPSLAGAIGRAGGGPV